MSKIAKALENLFDKHRIVLWYDNDKELFEEFEKIELSNIEKIELNNNEFGTKYRVLREAPENKFLIYSPKNRPQDKDNWLLDVLLSNAEFKTDQISIWLSDLGLGIEFKDIIKRHEFFFKDQNRIELLRKKINKDDTPDKLILKMISICINSDFRLENILETLLSALAKDNENELIFLLDKSDLTKIFWKQVKLHYGYDSSSPTLKDFSLELFKSCYQMELGNKATLLPEAIVFLKKWKDSITYKDSYEILSDRCSQILNIEKDLDKRELNEIVNIDYFELIDKKILSELVKNIIQKTILQTECENIIITRRQSHWYNNYANIYETLSSASKFISELNNVDLTIESISSGISQYVNSWYKLDQLYRKFIYNYKISSQTTLLEKLGEWIENLYSNEYLLKVNNNFQKHIDETIIWSISAFKMQNDFYSDWIKPFINRDQKVFVIISDALRYEIGTELVSLIHQEDRYKASIEPMISMLPSCTQIGMAALLPHNKLSIIDDNADVIFVDGTSSQGSENRAKILKSVIKESTVIKAEDLLSMNIDESRKLSRNNNVVYIYHNRIDSIGDKKDTEGDVFNAVEDCKLALIKIIKKLFNANISNLLLTSDHGFIYQNKQLDESDFLCEEESGEKIIKKSRRFLIGKGLQNNKSMKMFKSEDVGLTGDYEIQIPKSINRLRLQGAGSRFVHGGASLQEIILPVIHITKKRVSDIELVDVEIIKSSSNVITTGLLTVVFYQTRPISDKIRSRQLKAGIYSKDDKLISDSHNVIFELTNENTREREKNVKFILTKEADQFNGQDVFLKLEELETGTSYYKEYKTMRYTLRKSFTSDFDF